MSWLANINLDKYVKMEQHRIKKTVEETFKSKNNQKIKKLSRDTLIQYLDGKFVKKYEKQVLGRLKFIDKYEKKQEYENHLKDLRNDRKEDEDNMKEEIKKNPHEYGEETKETNGEIDL